MSSREKIIAAAHEVFAEKGKHGARMEEIALRAKINKAMLYYFYSSKENLYRAVLSDILARVFGNIHKKIAARRFDGRDPAEVIRTLVSRHIDAFSQNIKSNKILLEAITGGPDDVNWALENARSEALARGACLPRNDQLLAYFAGNVSKKTFRKIDPKQVLISIIGMNLIYFIAKPIARVMLDLDVRDEKKFLRERKESIIDLVLYGIMEKRNS